MTALLEEGERRGRHDQGRLMDRFKIDQVYGMHNSPGMAIGTLRRVGPAMAATDHIRIISGVGGHAARPQKASI